jgi:transposase
MKRIPRRIFTAEFKLEGIKLVSVHGLTHAEAARKLDIDPKSLKQWQDKHERGELKASLGVSKLTPDQQRIRELERELAVAKMERDILKKATAYFARESK